MSTDLADWDKLEASYTFLPYSSTGPSLWIIVSLHVERKRANNIIPNVHNICYRNYFVDASRANWQTNVQHLNRFFFLFPPPVFYAFAWWICRWKLLKQNYALHSIRKWKYLHIQYICRNYGLYQCWYFRLFWYLRNVKERWLIL